MGVHIYLDREREREGGGERETYTWRERERERDTWRERERERIRTRGRERLISKVGWICGGNREANTSRMERGNEGGPNKEAGVNKYRLAWHCGLLENSPIIALRQLSFGDRAALFDGPACPWFSSPQDGIYIYMRSKKPICGYLYALTNPPPPTPISLYIYMQLCVQLSSRWYLYMYMRSEKPICGSVCLQFSSLQLKVVFLCARKSPYALHPV